MSKVLAQENTYATYCELKIKQSKNRMITRIIVVAFVWALILGFLFSPLSRSRINKIEGNALNFNDNYIYEVGEFNKDSFIWHNDYKEIEEKLKSHRYLNNIEINYGLFGLNVSVDEVILVGKSNESDPTYYLSDGTSILHSDIKSVIDDPIRPEQMFIGKYKNSVANINKSTYTPDEFVILVKELGDIDHSLLMKVKDIACNKTYSDFNATMLTFSKETTGLEEELNISVDTTEISDLLNADVVDSAINMAKTNKKYQYFVDTKDGNINIYTETKK